GGGTADDAHRRRHRVGDGDRRCARRAFRGRLVAAARAHDRSRRRGRPCGGGAMKATLLGLIIALFGVIVGGFFKGVSPVVLVTNVPALLIVVVGALGATMASFEMKATASVFSAIKRAIF